HCFRITSSLGLIVVTDPFDPDLLKYPAPKNLRADVCLISHEESCCNNSELIANAPLMFRSNIGVGLNRAYGLLFKGVQTSASDAEPNTAFAWTMDGVRFAHLGAKTANASELSSLGKIDVLFV